VQPRIRSSATLPSIVTPQRYRLLIEWWNSHLYLDSACRHHADRGSWRWFYTDLHRAKRARHWLRPLVLNFLRGCYQLRGWCAAERLRSSSSECESNVGLITIAHVRYLKKIARLVINASDFTPGVTLTVTSGRPEWRKARPAIQQPDHLTLE